MRATEGGIGQGQSCCGLGGLEGGPRVLQGVTAVGEGWEKGKKVWVMTMGLVKDKDVMEAARPPDVNRSKAELGSGWDDVS